MKRVFLLLSIVACTKKAPTETAPVASSTPIATASSSAPAKEELPKSDFGPSGPIVVTGYPAKIGSGMDDSADSVGFTSDGKEFGYCMQGGGRGETRCVFRDASGRDRNETDVVKDEVSAKKTKEIADWLKKNGVPEVTSVKGTFERDPPPIKGTWAYARDISIKVIAGSGDVDDKGGAKSQPFVRVGGVLAGEDPVWVVTMSAPHRKMGGPKDPEIPYHFTALNGFQLSPDGKELGMVSHSFCMEYCDDFEIVRMSVDAFAGQVYNDVGFRHHKKSELAKSADFFLKAANADPSKDLYLYNLACAYARLSDPKAKLALSLAIAKGGDKIKTRAKGDEDFASVKTEAWFIDLTR